MLEAGHRGQAQGRLQFLHQLPAVEGVQEIDVSGTAGQNLNRQIAATRRVPNVTTGDGSLPNAPNMNTNKNTNTNRTESEKKMADKPPRASRFTPPSVEEVSAYCRERRNSVDAQRFVDFYASKGWKVGKEAMKDWKAAVRTWERRDQTDKPNSIRTPERYLYNEEDSL